MAGTILDRTGLEQPPADGSTPGFIPTAYAQEIIQEAAKTSMALATFRQIPIPTKSNNLPVLDSLPTAQWVTGEPTAADETLGQKDVTSQAWKGVVLTAEEIAATVPVPEAVLEDSTVDIWAQVTPRIAESLGKALDAAAFVGTNAPASWSHVIVDDAATATNTLVAAAPDQADYNSAFALVEADGFVVRQVYAPLAEAANYRSWNAAGIPVYLSDVRSDGVVDKIYGRPIAYDEFSVLPAGTIVVGDPTKAIIGTRTDMQVKFLSEATIDVSAAQDGSAMLNLAQQDSIAMRVRARFAFAVANPVTHANVDEATRYPFATITAA